MYLLVSGKFMKNRTLIFTLFLWFSIYCKAQENTPFYEQTALDFYNSEILKTSDLNVRLKISDDLKSIHYIDAECLIKKIVNEKNISSLKTSKYFEGYSLSLKNIDKKLLKKVKKINNDFRKENYVIISIAQEFNNRIFVVINEIAEGKGRIFTLEFNKSGNIIDWCKSSEYIKMTFE